MNFAGPKNSDQNTKAYYLPVEQQHTQYILELVNGLRAPQFIQEFTAIKVYLQRCYQIMRKLLRLEGRSRNQFTLKVCQYLTSCLEIHNEKAPWWGGFWKCMTRSVKHVKKTHGQIVLDI